MQAEGRCVCREFLNDRGQRYSRGVHYQDCCEFLKGFMMLELRKCIADFRSP